MNLLEKISKSKIITIAYDSINEYNANRIISLLPHSIIFKGETIESINDYFNSASYNREYKLESILGIKDVYFVIDITSIEIIEKDILSRTKKITQCVRGIQSKLYQLNNNESQTNLYLILLTNTYSNFTISNNIKLNNHIKGGVEISYMSDLIIRLNEDFLYVDKDRIEGLSAKSNARYELRQIILDNLI